MADEQNPNDPYGSYGQQPSGQSYSQDGATQAYGQDASQGYGQSQPQSQPQGQYGSDAQYGLAPDYGQAPQVDAGQYQAAPSYGEAPQYGAAGYADAPQQYGGAAAYGASGQYGNAAVQTPPKFNIWGLIALIAGGLALILAIAILAVSPILALPVGFLGFVALVTGILGLVLKGYNAKKGMAIAGLVLGVLSGIVAVITSIIWSANFATEVVNSYPTYSSSTYGSDSGSGSSTTGSGSGSSTSGSGSGSGSSTSGTGGTTANGLPTGTPVNVEVTVTAASGVTFDSSVSMYTEDVSDSKNDSSQTAPVSYTATTTLGSNPLVWATGSSTKGSGDVTCEIKVDGKVVSSDTGSFVFCDILG